MNYIEKYEATTSDPWREDPDHPMADWKAEVLQGDTLLGYWQWVKNQENNKNG